MTAHDALMTDLAVTVSYWLLLIGMACCFWRMVRGPSLADRIVAIDMLTVLMVAFAGVYVIATGEAAFLDAAIVLALTGFIGTVALARYKERLLRQEPATDGPRDRTRAP